MLIYDECRKDTIINESSVKGQHGGAHYSTKHPYLFSSRIFFSSVGIFLYYLHVVGSRIVYWSVGLFYIAYYFHVVGSRTVFSRERTENGCNMFSDCSIFRHPYVPTPLCSDTPMFWQLNLYSDTPINRHPYVSKPIYSDNPNTPCSDNLANFQESSATWKPDCNLIYKWTGNLFLCSLSEEFNLSVTLLLHVARRAG